MSEDRYKMLKNFLHNELGITKDEIREWVMQATMDAAQKEFKRMFEQTNMDAKFQEVAKREFEAALRGGTYYSGRDSTVSKAIAEKLAAKIWDNMRVEFKEPTLGGASK